MQDNVDSEWRRLRDVYAAMGNDELEMLAGQRGELTGVAQEALDAAMKERGLALPVNDPTAAEDGQQGARGAALFPDNAVMDLGEADAGWMVVWASPLVVQIRKATAVLEAHEIPFRLKAEPLQQGAAARTNEMGRMYLSVEEQRRSEAETLLRAETDLFAREEEIDAAYLTEEDSDADLTSVGIFQDPADIALAEQTLRDAGIWFTATKETVEADESVGAPASEVVNVQVKFEEYERAVAVLEKGFAEDA